MLGPQASGAWAVVALGSKLHRPSLQAAPAYSHCAPTPAYPHAHLLCGGLLLLITVIVVAAVIVIVTAIILGLGSLGSAVGGWLGVVLLAAAVVVRAAGVGGLGSSLVLRAGP